MRFGFDETVRLFLAFICTFLIKEWQIDHKRVVASKAPALILQYEIC